MLNERLSQRSDFSQLGELALEVDPQIKAKIKREIRTSRETVKATELVEITGLELDEVLDICFELDYEPPEDKDLRQAMDNEQQENKDHLRQLLNKNPQPNLEDLLEAGYDLAYLELLAKELPRLKKILYQPSTKEFSKDGLRQAAAEIEERGLDLTVSNLATYSGFSPNIIYYHLPSLPEIEVVDINQLRAEKAKDEIRQAAIEIEKQGLDMTRSNLALYSELDPNTIDRHLPSLPEIKVISEHQVRVKETRNKLLKAAKELGEQGLQITKSNLAQYSGLHIQTVTKHLPSLPEIEVVDGHKIKNKTKKTKT